MSANNNDMNIKHFVLVIFVLGLFGCAKTDPSVYPPLPAALGDGFFVLNQGNFTSGNASLSFYQEESGVMTNNLFYKLNQAPLGDVAQSMCFYDDLAFIVVNNSGHIYAIDAHTGLFKRKIAQLKSPRNMLVIDATKAYVSDFQEKGVFVFHPQTMQPLGLIQTGKSTEAMVKIDNEVFVTNWSNYNQTKTNNTVQVIDATLDQLVDSIVVAKEPNSMVVDHEGDLWVLCSGGYLNEEIPALFEIDASSRLIKRRFNFPHAQMSPEQLIINGTADTLYFLNRDIYRMSVNAGALPEIPFILAENRNFFTIAVHPQRSIVLATDAINYVQNGYIFRFQPNGMLIDSIKVGIIPGFIGFNYE